MVEFIARRINLRDADGRSARRWDAVKSVRDSPRKDNHPVTTPRPACISRRVAKCLQRPTREVNPSKLSVGEEPDGPAVRRPEGLDSALSPGERPRVQRAQRAY